MESREDGRDWAYRVDPYGFERPEDFDYASYEAFFSRYLVVLTRRAIKWSKLLKRNNGIQKSLKGTQRPESLPGDVLNFTPPEPDFIALKLCIVAVGSD